MARLHARAMGLGAKAAAIARERIAERIGDDLPGIASAIDGERIVLTGRRLRVRLLSEPLLRWIGSLAR
ncbi:hypothetical protein ACFO8O_01780 [Hephaestia sp. GCM10023244]|uniref:hypothetical protein n=1 Tax=unclassified Hephaestia TaxID=2631281 RepID=UPI00207781DD|nr:hypothetical protein [Hephaestia sp. MAHUQ-44]MCM8729701.1 hypothetical protein [Hephaestia sp. MAHUQ-44]